MLYKLGLKVPKSKKRGHNRHQPSIMSDPQAKSEIDRLNQKLEAKFKKTHLISKKEEINQEPALDMKFVNRFHLKDYAPLEHQLNDPLFQNKKLDKYIPSRFHLMTKESYKCPNKCCEKYVCKPTLRGRQANYEKRTAVLDYLPKIEIKLISGIFYLYNITYSTNISPHNIFIRIKCMCVYIFIKYLICLNKIVFKYCVYVSITQMNIQHINR